MRVDQLQSKRSEFQSTLPREERPRKPTDKQLFKIFQSTLPREERRGISVPPNKRNGNFNPRSHERSDDQLREFKYELINFNPRSHERSDSNIAQKICLFLYNTDNKYIIR